MNKRFANRKSSEYSRAIKGKIKKVQEERQRTVTPRSMKATLFVEINQRVNNLNKNGASLQSPVHKKKGECILKTPFKYQILSI